MSNSIATTRERLNRFRTSLAESFVARDEVVDLMVVSAIAQEPVLLVGEPGTCKSTLCVRFSEALGIAEQSYFEYMLTGFTEPAELLGPVDITKLQDGRYLRRVEGKLPSAEVAFLDEIFKGNSAILNVLLTLIQERKYYQDGKSEKAPLKVLFAASNEIPNTEDSLALRDRFLFKVPLRSVQGEHFDELLTCSLAAEADRAANRKPWIQKLATMADLLDAHKHIVQQLARQENGRPVDFVTFCPPDVFQELKRRVAELRHAHNVMISDRKIEKLYRAMRIHAWLLEGGTISERQLQLLRYAGNTVEELDKLASVVPKLA